MADQNGFSRAREKIVFVFRPSDFGRLRLFSISSRFSWVEIICKHSQSLSILCEGQPTFGCRARISGACLSRSARDICKTKFNYGTFFSDEKYFVRNLREGDDHRANCFIISYDSDAGRRGESRKSSIKPCGKWVRKPKSAAADGFEAI